MSKSQADDEVYATIEKMLKEGQLKKFKIADQYPGLSALARVHDRKDLLDLPYIDQ